MSFVLDALRKSEHERQRQLGPGITELPVVRPRRTAPWTLLAIGGLVLLNVLVLTVLLLREAPSAPPATTAAPPPVPAEIVAAAPAPAAAAILPAAAPPAPRSLPDDAPPATAAVAPPPAPDPTLVPAAPPAVPPSSATVTRAIEETPPAISELPAEATAGLPQLAIDLHVFTDDPARRAIFVNGRRYQQGGTLAEGPTVREITRDGAILDWQGRRFLLPRQ
ncbi:MAG: hypothetical protein FJ191_10740 [Gammaproteobacteria bacterium]|nr:hypothetical protein [Gammaproteobacteria bacterium]